MGVSFSVPSNTSVYPAKSILVTSVLKLHVLFSVRPRAPGVQMRPQMSPQSSMQMRPGVPRGMAPTRNISASPQATVHRPGEDIYGTYGRKPTPPTNGRQWEQWDDCFTLDIFRRKTDSKNDNKKKSQNENCATGYKISSRCLRFEERKIIFQRERLSDSFMVSW